MSQALSFGITTVEQQFPDDPGIATYRFALHDAAGIELQAKSFTAPPTLVSFDVPAGTWTVRGSQLTSAGVLVGSVVESASFTVAAITRVVISGIELLLP